ncbi:hypothetical protein Patl1_20302 [Pistacia atlantica]|uniref:Uncharacterized protein n=1 Tax=Pistacia atlantica TaxID=434234 RepID=A0ACC1BJL7_9ROSI|nr:hypothetical protein Patl1_20302 [Pistacia atlantica]
MIWEMEIDEFEAVLEKIWDLHDKLSDAIHSISRTHFLNSIKSLKKSEKKKLYSDVADENRAGFVFVKGFRVDDNDSAIKEAKSLNAIRTALENLEDQLEFLHVSNRLAWFGPAVPMFAWTIQSLDKCQLQMELFTLICSVLQTIQVQQRAERDTAIARLEQSRIVLAMRLAEHHGKKHKVIEEALAFVGDVHDAAHFISPENLYSSPVSPSGNLVTPKGKQSNMIIQFLISSFNFAKNSLKLDHMGGVLGNAAMVAVSMIAFLHLHQVAYKEHPQKQEDKVYSNRNVRKAYQLEDSSSSDGQLNHLDVLLARG